MINDHVEVFLRRVTPRPTRFMEYQLPGSGSKERSQATSTCYVEAKNNERFNIHIRLHPGFRYFTATCLEMRLWLDAHQEPDVYIRKKVHLPIYSRRHHEYVIDDFAVQVGDRWENGLLCFGEVQLDDDKDKIFKQSELKDRSMKLGTIRLSIQRGRVEPGPVPEEEVESVTLDGHVSSSSMHNGITHYVKTVDNRVIEPPKSDASNLFRQITGRYGERFVFEFRYRSRGELQRLGMMSHDGGRIDPLLVENDDGLPVVPGQHPGPSGGTMQPTASHPSSSPLFVSQSVSQPESSSQGLFSSPPSGYSAANTRISSVSGSRPKQSFISGEAGPAYTPSSPTLQGSNKKRLLPASTGSSAYPPPKKRITTIDLTGSPSPPHVQQPSHGPPSLVKFPASSTSSRPHPAATSHRSSLSGPFLPVSSFSSPSTSPHYQRAALLHRIYGSPPSFDLLTNTGPKATAVSAGTSTAPAGRANLAPKIKQEQQTSQQIEMVVDLSPAPLMHTPLPVPRTPDKMVTTSAADHDQTPVSPPSFPPFSSMEPTPDTRTGLATEGDGGYSAVAGAELGDIDDDMTEEELRLEIQRMELQKRQLELRIRLERMKRLQRRGG